MEDQDVSAPGGRYSACSARVKESLLNWDPDKLDLELVLAMLEHICLHREEVDLVFADCVVFSVLMACLLRRRCGVVLAS